MQGKIFKNIRKQLNAIEKDKSIYFEYFTMKDLPMSVLQEIQDLIQVWRTQSTSAQKNFVKSVSSIVYDQCKKGSDVKDKLENIHIVLARKSDTRELVCYGIDHLLPYNVIVLTEGKMNYKYTKDYPDLNKLINHFEVTNIVNKYNLDKDKIHFSLDLEIIGKGLPESYLDFKRRLAPNREISFGAMNGKRQGYIMYTNKSSIF